jgi:hypothetical protein
MAGAEQLAQPVWRQRLDRLGGTFQGAPMVRHLVEGAEARDGYSSSIWVCTDRTILSNAALAD